MTSVGIEVKPSVKPSFTKATSRLSRSYGEVIECDLRLTSGRPKVNPRCIRGYDGAKPRVSRGCAMALPRAALRLYRGSAAALVLHRGSAAAGTAHAKRPVNTTSGDGIHQLLKLLVQVKTLTRALNELKQKLLYFQLANS